MTTEPIPGPDAAARAELEAMAARGGQNGMRARIVLALARGEAPARVVEAMGVTYATVRAARRRFAAGGAAALATRIPVRRTAPPPEGEEALRLRSGVPDVLLAWEEAGKRRGRLPVARLAIETWARDAVALGAVAPGALFPPRRSVRKAFRTTTRVVQGAFASLARQGFARNVPGGGSHAPGQPPFAGRYLVACDTTGDPGDVGYIPSLLRAAKILEESRAARFEFLTDRTSVLETNGQERLRLLADIREQRWAGVFFRSWNDEMAALGPVRLDNVPICLFWPRNRRPASFHGTRVAKIDGPTTPAMLGPLLADCATAGCRRVAVLDHQDPRGAFRAGEVARLASERGLEIGPWHYQATQMIGETPGTRDAVRAILVAMLAPGRDWTPDGIVLMDDHWLGPLEEALDMLGARQGGTNQTRSAAPGKLFVACIGNKPALPATRLDVRFRGYDLLSTLDSFLSWCEAIHAGRKDPPPPVAATF